MDVFGKQLAQQGKNERLYVVISNVIELYSSANGGLSSNDYFLLYI